MKEGGKRKLTVPPDMGYGPQGTPDGKIPPNSTLLFEIELLSVK
jgi:FKBP-type peptidyl-prolyl cis-trans isomerase